jgi:hypothetical protein
VKNTEWNGMHDGKIYNADLRRSRKARKSHAQRKAEIAARDSGRK